MPKANQPKIENDYSDLLLYDLKAVSTLLHLSSLQAETITAKSDHSKAISFRMLASYFIRLGAALYDSESDRTGVIESIIHDSPDIFDNTKSPLQRLADYSHWLHANHENLSTENDLQLFFDRVLVIPEGVPQTLFPFTRLPIANSPRLILIDPRYRLGMPTTRRRIPTDIIFGRYRAGDSVADLAEDYELDFSDIDEAIRYEILLNTPLLNPREVLV